MLSTWVERTRADERFAGWEVTFKGVGKWPGSSACIEVIGPDVVATLAAWPNGCVDLGALRCSDEHLVQHHDEVPTVEGLLGVLAEFAGTVLGSRQASALDVPGDPPPIGGTELHVRVEATLPDSRGQALDQLADELGLSRSQVVDEAVGLFLKAVLEARRGHRLVTISGDKPACELSTPTLAVIEWTARSQPLVLSDSAVEKIADLLDNPPARSARLTQALRRKR